MKNLKKLKKNALKSVYGGEFLEELLKECIPLRNGNTCCPSMHPTGCK